MIEMNKLNNIQSQLSKLTRFFLEISVYLMGVCGI